MCGIAGIIKTNGAPIDKDELKVVTEALRHRGPDGSGMHMEGNIGLGHRRLAIIDLERGAQPLSNEDGTVWITFNGEIYNFRELRERLIKLGHNFATNSDTEVIVHAYEQWGAEHLTHLRGMFAFAIWDKSREELFLARDRLGIKPLCYYASPDCFAFASEMQAFRKLNRYRPALDLDALDIYLHFQYIPAPFSIYREVRKLPPAHYMVVGRDGSIHGPSRYWDMEFRPDHKLTENEWIERLDAELRETVKAHLVSDVPFGAFLSGGVDSSAVAAYMSKALDKPLRTFTIGFDDIEYDERKFAREAASALGAQHYEQVVSPNAIEILPKLVEHYGEPFADSSAIPTYYISRMASEHVKMVLSGDGGDETFAGYDYFSRMLYFHPEISGRLRKARRLAGNIAREIGLISPLPSLSDTWYERSPYFNEEYRLKLWRPEFHSLLQRTRAWNDSRFGPVRKLDTLSQCQYVDIHNYLPYDNLNKVDIASMCHGLEVRVPLLDHVFLETVSAVPPEMKLKSFKSNGDTSGQERDSVISKYILKRTVERFFNPGFLDRRKFGFSMPVPSWFAGSWGDDLESRISDSSLLMGDLFDTNYMNSLIREHRERKNHGWRLWSLLFLAEWMRQSKT